MKSSPEMSSFPAPCRWWTLSLVVAVTDQVSKYAIAEWLPFGSVMPLTTFFNLVHFGNTGAAFSFLADAGGWQRYFFIAAALIVSIGLALLLRKPIPESEALSYSLILGGAVGNLIDRALRGHVIDYLDLHWESWHWPAFNLADMSIVGGVTLLLLSGLLSKSKNVGNS
ncbi:MAG: signal peptidase II [Pseudomonadota bacterium]